MSSPVVTPNMSLTEPAIGTTLSPAWATYLNANFGIIDSHTHEPGSGVPITPSAINITSDLLFNDNNATTLRSTRYTSQGSPLALGTDLNCTYVSGVDLYYNDGDGNQIRLTASGAPAGTPGSIANLVAPASATWVALTQTFVWSADSGIAANMDAGTLIVRYPGSYPTPSGNYIALQAPTSLATGYALTLPALPVSNSFVQLTSAGTISATIPLSKGITASNIADATITHTQVAVGGIIGSNIETNVDLDGFKALVGGAPIVTSALPVTKGLLIVAGSFNGSGTPTVGSGFTVSRTGVGQYTVTFNTTYGTAPVVITQLIVTPNYSSIIFSTSTSQTVIRTFDSVGSSVDTGVSFIAIGERA